MCSSVSTSSDKQEECLHRGMKRSLSSSGTFSAPKRTLRDGAGGPTRRPPPSRLHRVSAPGAVSAAPTRQEAHRCTMEEWSDRNGSRNCSACSSGVSVGAGATADPETLSRLLDSTVQMLSAASLLRQPSAPAVMQSADSGVRQTVSCVCVLAQLLLLLQ